MLQIAMLRTAAKFLVHCAHTFGYWKLQIAMLSTAEKSLTRCAQIFDHWMLQIAMLSKAEKFWRAALTYLVYMMI